MFSPVRPAAANGHFVKNPKPHRRTVFRFTRRQDAERPGILRRAAQQNGAMDFL